MPFPSSSNNGPQQLDGPPPSPVTSPPAASESSQMKMLTGGAAPGQPGGPGAGQPAGAPDMSGIMMLGQKIEEALLSLAQALPAQGGIFGQAAELLKNGIAQAMQSQPGGGAGTQPGGGAPAGSVTQAGNQFPGGGFGAGRSA